MEVKDFRKSMSVVYTIQTEEGPIYQGNIDDWNKIDGPHSWTVNGKKIIKELNSIVKEWEAERAEGWYR